MIHWGAPPTRDESVDDSGAPTGHGIPARGATPGVGRGTDGVLKERRIGGLGPGAQLRGWALAIGRRWVGRGRRSLGHCRGGGGARSRIVRSGSTSGSRAWISRIRTLKFHAMSESNPLSNWTPEQIRLGKQWVRSWAETGAIMDQLRREALRKTDTVESLQRLAGAFESARHMGLPRLSSGLVAQQAFFLKCRPALHG